MLFTRKLMRGLSRSSTNVQSDAPAAQTPLDECLGIKVLYDGENPVVDIIAVHGLNGHRERTWMSDRTNKLWLQDFLPQLIPNIRVLTYGYDASIYKWQGQLSTMSLSSHGSSLAEQLSQFRHGQDIESRPIIFIAHGIGGILVKRALIRCHSAGTHHLPHLKRLERSTYAILFFSTPHLGVHSGKGADWLINMYSVFTKVNTKMRKNLERDSEFLLELSDLFLPISHEFEMLFFCETLDMPRSVTILPQTVARHAAVVPGAVNVQEIYFNRDHVHMVQFDTLEDDHFQRVFGYVQNMIAEAPGKISAKWEANMANIISNPEDGFKIPMRLPFSQNFNFTGRKEELQIVASWIKESHEGKMTVIVLYGLGGVGKTELAAEIAYQHLKAFTSVFWLSGASEETLHSGYFHIAEQIKLFQGDRLDQVLKTALLGAASSISSGFLAEGQIEHKTGQAISSARDNLRAAVQYWLGKPGNTQWLLIIDNVDDMALFDSSGFLPLCAHGTVIMTSRRQESSQLGLHSLEIQSMTPYDAACLLVKRVHRVYSQLSKADHEEVNKIVETLGHLPLAIELAGGYIHALDLSFSKYLPRYNERFKDLMSTKLGIIPRGSQSVYATWEVTYYHIQDSDTNVKQLLSMLSVLSNIVPEEVFTSSAIFDDKGFDEAIGALMSYSMIKYNKSKDSLWIHPVVHRWLQDQSNWEEKQETIHCTIEAIANALQKSSSDSWENYPLQIRMLQNTITVVDHYLSLPGQDQEESNGNIDDSLTSLAYLLTTQGYAHKAESLYIPVLGRKVIQLGQEQFSTELADAKLFMAHIYAELYQYSNAQKLYEQILHIVEKNLGSKHASTLVIKHEVAVTHRELGQISQALELFQIVLIAAEETLGPYHPSTLITKYEVAVTHRAFGQLSEALELFQAVLKAEEETLQPNHPSTLVTRYQVAITHRELGQASQALELFQAILHTEEETLGPDHPSTLVTKHEVAVTHCELGQISQALELFQAVLSSEEKTLGPNHPSSLITKRGVAVTYRGLGQTSQALELFHTVLRAAEETLEPNHLSVLVTKYEVAVTYREIGQISEALGLFQAILSIAEETLGPDHSFTLATKSEVEATHLELESVG